MTAAYAVPRIHAILARENITKEPIPQDPGFSSELFHRLYAEAPRELPASPGNATRRATHALVSELPEFETLRQATTRDPLWAAIGTQAMAQSVAGKLPTNAGVDRASAVLDGMRDLQAMTPQDLGSQLGQASKVYTDAVELDEHNASMLDASAIRNALRAGIAQAQEDIAQAESTLQLLGYGMGPGSGSPNTSNNPALALEIARRVRTSSQLSAIIELAGRLVSTARAKKASRSEYARSEVVGVEQTNDISHLLGSEMALLTDPVMGDDLLIRLSERRALGYKMRGSEKLAKGPIVLMLDQSGSMMGVKDTWAKAIALALYDAARSDNRAFAVVTYDGTIRRTTRVTSPADMLEAISEYADGSNTDYVDAMIRCLELCDATKADIVHLTDGSAPTHAAKDLVNRANILGAHIYGIGIGLVGPALAAWSHTSTQITDVNKDSAAMDLIFGEGGI